MPYRADALVDFFSSTIYYFSLKISLILFEIQKEVQMINHIPRDLVDLHIFY